MFRSKEPDPFAWSGVTNQNPGGLSFFELVREDFEAHGRHASPGFRALAVHRFGNWRMDIRWRALRVPVTLVYRRLFRRMIRLYGIELEYAAEIGRRVTIDHQSGIVISGFCRVGDGCRIRHNVTMGVRRIGEIGCPTLGRNVDVGVGAVILGDIHVGDDAAIGANAVVLQDVPAGAIAVGVPARIVHRAQHTAPQHTAPQHTAPHHTAPHHTGPTPTDGDRHDESGTELTIIDVR